MEIFRVSPNQISNLDEHQLVELTRRLVHAEMKSSEIPLRSGIVQAQIHIPDGGEDGSVSWRGAPNDTDYFPCRMNIFQLKKSAPGPAGMKKEIWKKSSRQDGNPPELKDALEKALENSGSYIMITADPIVGNKRDRRIKAIEDGIKEAGGDPSLLVAIEIYDANKLADWTNIHPAVALWLNSMLSGFHTLGLRTYDDWSKDEMIHKTAFQTTDEKRYRLRSVHIQKWKESNPDFEEYQNLAQLRISIAEFFKSFGRSLRITGPSGYGKTRLAHSILLPDDVQAGESLDPRQVVFCKYKDVEQRLIPIATGITQSGSLCTLVVDDCPDEIHQELHKITRRQDSKLHIITLDVETRTEGVNGNLVIELTAASDELIDLITRSVAPNISHVDVSYVRELSQGFPSMAILGVEAIDSGDQKLSSVDALVSRIVWGNSQADDEVHRSLQVLSLFTVLGIDNEAAEELKQVSNFLGRPYEAVFRDIIRFSNRGVIRRIGDFAEVQPVPLAARLESEWLDNSPSERLKELFRSLSPDIQLRMAGRLRWLSWSEKVQNFANQMLSELVPDFDKLNTKFGSEILDRFTHLIPSGVMARLESLLGKLSIDELTVLEEKVGSNIVRLLEKLIFPAETFEKAASLLLRLSGVKNRCWSDNADKLFLGLFQLRLSGTEAEPKIKIRVLDAGLSSDDDRTRSICIKKALESMLRTGHFSRNCGHERIGVGEALKDWQPKSYEEIFEYYRLALIRLEEIALSKTDVFSRDAVNSISYKLSGILKSGFPCDEVIELIKRISSQVPRWWDVIKALNRSLYDDSGEEMDNEVRQSILDAYLGLIPDDPIEKLLMLSSGWMDEFRDPEIPFESDGDNYRHYVERMINETVSSCPSEASFFSPLLNIWLDICLEGTNDSFETALSAIAEHVDDPVVFVTALRKEVSNGREVGISANFIRIVIGGASKKNPSVGRKLLDEALQEEALRAFSPRMIASAGADDDLMAQVIEYINQGIVNSDQLGYLAPRNVLSDVSPAVIDRLVSALLSRGCEGAWSAISFLRIHTYGQSSLSALEADMIRRAITHTELFEKRHYDRMDSSYWKELTGKLFNQGYIDENSAELITSVIIGLVDMQYSHDASDLISDAGSVLEQITDLYPRVVWRQYHEKKAQMSEVGDYILNRLFNSDVSYSSKPGVLYRVPQEVMIPWLLEDRENRIGEVLEWIRLFDSVGSNASWSDDFISFADNYVKESEELRPVYFRLMNGDIISGHYSKKLEIDRDHFEQLAEKTSNPSVKTWAASIINSLRGEIQETQREEANREALDLA